LLVCCHSIHSLVVPLEFNLTSACSYQQEQCMVSRQVQISVNQNMLLQNLRISEAWPDRNNISGMCHCPIRCNICCFAVSTHECAVCDWSKAKKNIQELFSTEHSSMINFTVNNWNMISDLGGMEAEQWECCPFIAVTLVSIPNHPW